MGRVEEQTDQQNRLESSETHIHTHTHTHVCYAISDKGFHKNKEI